MELLKCLFCFVFFKLIKGAVQTSTESTLVMQSLIHFPSSTEYPPLEIPGHLGHDSRTFNLSVASAVDKPSPQAAGQSGPSIPPKSTQPTATIHRPPPVATEKARKKGTATKLKSTAGRIHAHHTSPPPPPDKNPPIFPSSFRDPPHGVSPCRISNDGRFRRPLLLPPALAGVQEAPLLPAPRRRQAPVPAPLPPRVAAAGPGQEGRARGPLRAVPVGAAPGSHHWVR